MKYSVVNIRKKYQKKKGFNHKCRFTLHINIIPGNNIQIINF
jgi:hypothetical protein